MLVNKGFNLGYTSYNYHATESCRQTFLTKFNFLRILKSQINFFSYNSTFFCLKSHDSKKSNIIYKSLDIVIYVTFGQKYRSNHRKALLRMTGIMVFLPL